MPMYEYYCPRCQAKFEKLRSMSASDDAVRCANGHEGARRLISVFAMGNRSTEPVNVAAGGGGCCGGGGCACSRQGL